MLDCVMFSIVFYEVGVMDLITLGIALWGALLSTVLAIRTFWIDKRRIAVICRIVERTISSDGVHSLVVGIKAVNTGHRDVRLEYAGFKTRGGQYYVFQTRNLPVTLKDGDTITILANLDGVESWLKEISPSEHLAFAYVMDAERTQYKTSAFPNEMIERKMTRPKMWKK